MEFYSYNNLRELRPDTFHGLIRLYELDASHNELVALTDDLLAEQSNLHYISFAHNQIQARLTRILSPK